MHVSKNLVERIRVSVFASNQTQLVYTQKLYAFQTENASIEPLNLHEICEVDAAAAAAPPAGTDDEQLQFDGEQSQVSDDKPTDLLFNHEWIHQKVIKIKTKDKFYTFATTFFWFICTAIYAIPGQGSHYNYQNGIV